MVIIREHLALTTTGSEFNIALRKKFRGKYFFAEYKDLYFSTRLQLVPSKAAVIQLIVTYTR